MLLACALGDTVDVARARCRHGLLCTHDAMLVAQLYMAGPTEGSGAASGQQQRRHACGDDEHHVHVLA